jgi:hypothetical protein
MFRGSNPSRLFTQRMLDLPLADLIHRNYCDDTRLVEGQGSRAAIRTNFLATGVTDKN